MCLPLCLGEERPDLGPLEAAVHGPRRAAGHVTGLDVVWQTLQVALSCCLVSLANLADSVARMCRGRVSVPRPLR